MAMQNITDWLTNLPLDTALWVIVLVFIALDVVLGTVKAWSKHELSSSIARQGVMHKMGFIGAMLLCNIIDIAQSVADFGYSVPVTALCAIMIVACEVMSICEHLREMNPDINLDFLAKARGTEDYTDDAEDAEDAENSIVTVRVEGMAELVKTARAIDEKVK